MFLDSSVRSTRTISFRSPQAALSAATWACTSAAAPRWRRLPASTPRACTPTLVTRPRWVTVLATVSTSAPRNSRQQSRNASAQRWADAFLDCCREFLGADVDTVAKTVTHRGRVTSVGVHALGVDAGSLRQRGAAADVQAQVAALSAACGDRKLIVRVD